MAPEYAEEIERLRAEADSADHANLQEVQKTVAKWLEEDRFDRTRVLAKILEFSLERPELATSVANLYRAVRNALERPSPDEVLPSVMNRLLMRHPDTLDNEAAMDLARRAAAIVARRGLSVNEDLVLMQAEEFLAQSSETAPIYPRSMDKG